MQDMYNNQPIFKTIALHPHLLQYVINEVPAFFIAIISYWIYSCCSFMWHEYFLLVTLLTILYLIGRFLSLIRTEYIISGEQLIILQGVLTQSTNYVELYRVVDYQEHRSIMQQLVGLKTVSIYSGDRNNPVVNIIGIKANIALVAEIRVRVEYNKRRKGIYEVTNRF